MSDEAIYKKRAEQLQYEYWKLENRYNTLYIKFSGVCVLSFLIGFWIGVIQK